MVRPGEDQGRVVADFTEPRGEHARLDLARHPEIVEAVRSRRPLAIPDSVSVGSAAPGVVVPVVLEEEVAAVLVLRGRQRAPALNASQLGLAASLAEAAAKALEGERTGRPRRQRLTPLTLDRRLEEELERARRYSLGFSLVLVDVERPPDAPAEDDDAVARYRQETGARVRRELRLPDFVSGYGDGEYAIVLPETGADGARRSVLRLRERIPGVTAGIVAYPHPAVTVPDDLFTLVEAALRRGQAQSGERIGVAE